MSDPLSLATWESGLLWLAVTGFAIACAIAIASVALRKNPERTLLFFLAASTAFDTLAIVLRWLRLGHVPVGSVFEMLSANVWGLSIALTLGYWLLPRIRPAAVFILPIIVMLMGWMLLVPSADSMLPATYKTVWLFIHIGFIKLFIGCAALALSVSGVILARRTHWGKARFAKMPLDASLAELAYRFLAVGWIFDSLGIIAGAIWAQDAWGRYWSWDPLEVWSLITWLTIGFAVHMRSSFKLGNALSAVLVIAVWVIAFFTFFGVPFVATSLHKGVI